MILLNNMRNKNNMLNNNKILLSNSNNICSPILHLILLKINITLVVVIILMDVICHKIDLEEF